MLANHSANPHGTDDAFVRLLDGQLEPTDGELASHLGSCSACSARVSQLESRQRRLSVLLHRTAPPPIDAERLRPRASRGSWRRVDFRIAAGLLLVAGIAAASPARQWLLRQLTIGARTETATSPSTPARPADAPAPAAAVPAQEAGRIGFTPESSTLVVRFDARPAGGTLIVTPSANDKAVAEFAGLQPMGESFLVLPGELRVRNSARSTTDLRLAVPLSVSRIELRVGGARMTISVPTTSPRSVRLSTVR